MLSRDQILSVSDLTVEEVQIPEWKTSVYVRNMTGIERDSFEQGIANAKKEGDNLVNFRARLAVLTVCDSTGKRTFADADADILGTKSGKALDLIFDVASRLSGIGAKEADEIQGN